MWINYDLRTIYTILEKHLSGSDQIDPHIHIDVEHNLDKMLKSRVETTIKFVICSDSPFAVYADKIDQFRHVIELKYVIRSKTERLKDKLYNANYYSSKKDKLIQKYQELVEKYQISLDTYCYKKNFLEYQNKQLVEKNNELDDQINLEKRRTIAMRKAYDQNINTRRRIYENRLEELIRQNDILINKNKELEQAIIMKRNYRSHLPDVICIV